MAGSFTPEIQERVESFFHSVAAIFDAWQPNQPRPLLMERTILLHQPSPDAVPDIKVQSRELTTSASAEAIVVSPSPQDRIELLEEVRQ